MNIRNLPKALFAIFLLAFILRIFRLGSVPEGFHVDEVKVGWNALSIAQTGKDDRGNSLSLYYNSFGDFRPTGIFYVTIPSVLIFGPNEFAVRFPSAIFGALTIFSVYFLTLAITKNNKVSLFGSLILAISPWHISTSRATSEVVISVFFATTAIYFFIKGLSQRTKREILFGVIFLAISYFFYHSIRLLGPILVLLIIKEYWVQLKKLAIIKIAVIALVILSALTLVLISNKNARGRFSQVSIFTDLTVKYELTRAPFEDGQNNILVARTFHNKPTVYVRRFINEYSNYLSANYLIADTAKPERYKTPGVGLFTYGEIILLLIGLVAIAKNKYSVLPLFLFLASPIPAALTTEDSPNLHRSLMMVIFSAIIAAYGLDYLLQSNRQQKLLLRVFSLMLIGHFIFFLHMYFVHARMSKPLYRNVGAKELAITLDKEKGNYDKIILTNIPDDPYPWIAFFTKQNPQKFNEDAIKREQGTWASGNFTFTGLRCPSRDAFEKPEVKRLLVVDAEGCETESKLKSRDDVKILTQIKRPDESIVYTLWSRIE